MADTETARALELSDGTTISIDLYKLTVKEFREVVELDGYELTTERSDELLGKTVGLTAKQIGDLPYPDFRALSTSFWLEVNDLSITTKEDDADPN